MLVSSTSQASEFTFNDQDNIQLIGAAVKTLVNIGDPRKPPVRIEAAAGRGYDAHVGKCSCCAADLPGPGGLRLI